MAAEHHEAFRMVLQLIHLLLPFLDEMVLLACIHAKTVQNDLAETKMIGIDIPECFPRTQTDTLAEEQVHGFVAFPAE